MIDDIDCVGIHVVGRRVVDAKIERDINVFGLGRDENRNPIPMILWYGMAYGREP